MWPHKLFYDSPVKQRQQKVYILGAAQVKLEKTDMLNGPEMQYTAVNNFYRLLQNFP